MRAVIYARYSSENQREASIDDQIEVCRRYVAQQRWTLVRSYADRAISGASDQRPEYQQMIADAELGRFDVIVCEALDRLGATPLRRRPSPRPARVPRRQAACGEPRSGRRRDARRAARERWRSSSCRTSRRRHVEGSSAGRLPARFRGDERYGYRRCRRATLVIGEVIEAEAADRSAHFPRVRRRANPRARLRKELNNDGIPGPDGREWRDTTIRGQVDRGTGILNNAIYVGRLEWNRCSYVKDPRTGKRVARPNPQGNVGSRRGARASHRQRRDLGQRQASAATAIRIESRDATKPETRSIGRTGGSSCSLAC